MLPNYKYICPLPVTRPLGQRVIKATRNRFIGTGFHVIVDTCWHVFRTTCTSIVFYFHLMSQGICYFNIYIKRVRKLQRKVQDIKLIVIVLTSVQGNYFICFDVQALCSTNDSTKSLNYVLIVQMVLSYLLCHLLRS